MLGHELPADEYVQNHVDSDIDTATTKSSRKAKYPTPPKDISHDNITPTISDHSGIGKTAPVCWRNGSA
ncbi:Uncharacterized protein LW94_10695 [Fusarium fujikuroi]|nr:Uncharacterized protein LW94_10695 [Fusarium fujikuroi]